MTDHRTPVTVLGLGSMGTALAEAFIEAGHPTTVWNRTASKAAPWSPEAHATRRRSPTPSPPARSSSPS
ncbi:NAD(P)-binding domain-containing protein [Nonomuraea recticatena]|uniref:NAD(P)-binding domain-containing protein n=1 Tax=Nonomuraea recticatena TaxID=46178 RepID=UPI00360C7F1D